jgi:HB1, ASXL, restriction endonuclease HTH domain
VAALAAGQPQTLNDEKDETMATKKTTAKKTTTKKTATRKSATAKKAPAKATTKKPATKKVAAKTTGKKMSALDAAAKVLGEAKEPLNAKGMIERMAAKGYWTSPGGRTPHATLYAAILRDIQRKGDDSRFVKADRGLFAIKK